MFGTSIYNNDYYLTFSSTEQVLLWIKRKPNYFEAKSLKMKRNVRSIPSDFLASVLLYAN